MMKPGGTEGGERAFLMGAGFVLAAIGLYLFLDSVRVTTAPLGWVSGRLGLGSGVFGTTSMGVIFVPFLIGVLVLFYDAQKVWAWWLFGMGLFVICIEILSRVRFVLDMKTTSLLLLLGMIAAGAGLLARGYMLRSSPSSQDDDPVK